MKLDEYSCFDGIGLANLIKCKEVKPQELIDAVVESISKVNPKVNAIAQTLSTKAKNEVKPELSGPFQGVPFFLKEFPGHAAGIKAEMGSRLAKGYTPSRDSSLMTRFRQAGLITIGTTTCPDFALSASTESVLYGRTRNPWNLDTIAGGSSGGSAAAVAAGVVPISHANDVGGSIRIPASCCGVVGLKPTRGRIPVGPDFGEIFSGLGVEFAVTRSVRDTAALLDSIAGPDIGCYAWAEPPVNPYLEEISRPPKKLKIAWMGKPLNNSPVDSEVLDVLYETVKRCEEFGHVVVEDGPEINEEIHMRAVSILQGAHYFRLINKIGQIMNRIPSESNLDPAVWSAYQSGKLYTADDLLEATDIQNDISRKLGKFFLKYDALLSPTVAQLPPKLGELDASTKGLGVDTYLKRTRTYSPFVGVFNTTGQPAISLPLGWSSEGLPIGMQFAGRFADETTLLKLASQFEKAYPWKDRRPPVHVSK